MCSCLSASFQFFFHLFFVSFFWLFSSWSPSQHVSFQKMTCVTLYFLLLFILFPSVLSLSLSLSLSLPLLNFFFCSLLSPCFFTSNSLCNKKVIFLASAKKISVSFVGLLEKFIYFFRVWFFSVSWKMISHFEYLSSFFLLHLLNTVSLFYTLFFEV